MLEKSERYKRIAERLIATEPTLADIRDSGVKIAYLSSDEEKKKNRKMILGQCTKVSPQYAWCCPYDFFITIFEPNILSLNRKQIKILMLHELRHIGIDNDGDEPSFYIYPHDREDFDDIIERFGLTWNE